MTPIFYLAVLVLSCAASRPLPSQSRPASPSPAQLITRAVSALGGPAALDSVRSKTVEFNAVTFALGQEETPGSPARATFVNGRTTYDYEGTRLATNQEQRFVTGMVNRLRRVTLDRASMSEINGTAAMDPAVVPAGLERTLSLEIDQMLRAAMHHPSAASALPPRTMRGEVADGIRLAMGPDTVRLWFDRLTGLPLAAETLLDDGVLGDRRTITWYTRWQAAGPVKLARQVDVEVNGRLLSHTVITSASVNEALEASLFAIPDSMRPRAPIEIALITLAPLPMTMPRWLSRST